MRETNCFMHWIALSTLEKVQLGLFVQKKKKKLVVTTLQQDKNFFLAMHIPGKTDFHALSWLEF